MVVKKRKSKRITTRKRVKIERKVKETHSKKRKEESKKQKLRIKVPESIFRTEEENKINEEIKINSLKRQNKIEEQNKIIDLKILFTEDDENELIDGEEIPTLKIKYQENKIEENEINKIGLKIQEIQENIKSNESNESKRNTINVKIIASRNFNEIPLKTKFANSINFIRTVVETEDTLLNILRNNNFININNYKKHIHSLIELVGINNIILRYRISNAFIKEDNLDLLINEIGTNQNILNKNGNINTIKTSKWIIKDLKKEYKFINHNGLQILKK